MASIEFEGIQNVRDLGGILVADGRCVRSGLLYRGAALAKATPADCAKLRDELGIRLVIDVRTGWERAEKPDPVIEGIENRHIPFFDNDIVGIEYTRALPGTKTIGHDFACDPRDFYQAMANPLTARQIRQACAAALDTALAGRGVYIHCSGGKDRAGIMTVVILSVLGASRHDILDDYLLTNDSRDDNIQPVYERFLRLTDDEDLAWKVTNEHRAQPSNLTNFYYSIDLRYGSMDDFIRDRLGIDDAKRAAYIDSLTRT